MASPSVQATATSSTNTAGTSHTVTLPSGVVAGDLILIVMSIGSTAAQFDAHADYTELLDENSAVGLKIWYRWAAGGESNPTFTSSASTRDAACSFRISGAAHPSSQAPEIGTTATGSSTTPDPPSVAPTAGSRDYLFITFCGSAGEQADDGSYCTAFPTNYNSNQLEKTCGTAGTNLGGMIAAATRQLSASSDDPGTFTVSENNTWRAQTIVVHPHIGGTLSATVDTTLSAEGDLPVAGSLTATVDTTLSTEGDLLINGSLEATVATTLDAQGSLSGEITGSVTATVDTTLTAEGDLPISGSLTTTTTTTLTAEGDLPVVGSVAATLETTLSASGNGTTEITGAVTATIAAPALAAFGGGKKSTITVCEWSTAITLEAGDEWYVTLTGAAADVIDFRTEIRYSQPP